MDHGLHMANSLTSIQSLRIFPLLSERYPINYNLNLQANSRTLMGVKNNVEEQRWRHQSYYKARVIKALWGCSGMQNLETDLHICDDLNYDKLAISIQ